MTITFELATEYNYPHINTYRRYRDGELSGWKFETEEGYVMYNPNDETYEEDPETGLEVRVHYYYTQYNASFRFDPATFPYIAVPRDSVDENYIFGGGDNDHEVM